MKRHADVYSPDPSKPPSAVPLGSFPWRGWGVSLDLQTLPGGLRESGAQLPPHVRFCPVMKTHTFWFQQRCLLPKCGGGPAIASSVSKAVLPGRFPQGSSFRTPPPLPPPPRHPDSDTSLLLRELGGQWETQELEGRRMVPTLCLQSQNKSFLRRLFCPWKASSFPSWLDGGSGRVRWANIWPLAAPKPVEGNLEKRLNARRWEGRREGWEPACPCSPAPRSTGQQVTGSARTWALLGSLPSVNFQPSGSMPCLLTAVHMVF